MNKQDPDPRPLEATRDGRAWSGVLYFFFRGGKEFGAVPNTKKLTAASHSEHFSLFDAVISSKREEG